MRFREGFLQFHLQGAKVVDVLAGYQETIVPEAAPCSRDVEKCNDRPFPVRALGNPNEECMGHFQVRLR